MCIKSNSHLASLFLIRNWVCNPSFTATGVPPYREISKLKAKMYLKDFSKFMLEQEEVLNWKTVYEDLVFYAAHHIYTAHMPGISNAFKYLHKIYCKICKYLFLYISDNNDCWLMFDNFLATFPFLLCRKILTQESWIIDNEINFTKSMIGFAKVDSNVFC